MKDEFQRGINTLHAALDIAAVVDTELGELLAVLDLDKAYDRVIRKLLVEKLESHGVPLDLVSQLIVFLGPLLVRTAGDLTRTVALLTTGLLQGGTASLTLFRFFINDLAGDLRMAVSGSRKPTGPILTDPGKLVANDGILVDRSPEELKKLLDVCTDWASKNGQE